MSIVYLLQNQHEQFLSKSREWVDGKVGAALFRTEFKDEAINQKVEFSVKQAELRITLVEARIGKDGRPELLQGSNDDHALPTEALVEAVEAEALEAEEALETEVQALETAETEEQAMLPEATTAAESTPSDDDSEAAPMQASL